MPDCLSSKPAARGEQFPRGFLCEGRGCAPQRRPQPRGGGGPSPAGGMLLTVWPRTTAPEGNKAQGWRSWRYPRTKPGNGPDGSLRAPYLLRGVSGSYQGSGRDADKHHTRPTNRHLSGPGRIQQPRRLAPYRPARAEAGLRGSPLRGRAVGAARPGPLRPAPAAGTALAAGAPANQRGAVRASAPAAPRGRPRARRLSQADTGGRGSHHYHGHCLLFAALLFAFRSRLGRQVGGRKRGRR